MFFITAIERFGVAATNSNHRCPICAERSSRLGGKIHWRHPDMRFKEVTELAGLVVLLVEAIEGMYEVVTHSSG